MKINYDIIILWTIFVILFVTLFSFAYDIHNHNKDMKENFEKKRIFIEYINNSTVLTTCEKYHYLAMASTNIHEANYYMLKKIDCDINTNN
jgi:hypothetical protein